MKRHLPILLSVSLLVAGCLGGKSSSGSGGAKGVSGGTSLGGIAATGAPIVNGEVDVKGQNGVVVRTSTDSTGAYSVNVETLVQPYLIMVTAISGEKLISVASQRDIEARRPVNVTPISHAIVAKVFENKNPDTLFSGFQSAATVHYSDTALDAKKAEFKQSLIDAGVLGNSGIIGSAGLDLMNGTFVAGSGAGMDKLLDALDVNVSTAANVEIKFKGSATILLSAPMDSTPVVVANVASPSDVSAIGTQLSALESIKAFYTSTGAKFAAMIPCNGEAVDDGSSCDKDTLNAVVQSVMDADYKWGGLTKAQDSWDFFCKQEEDGEGASSKAECHWVEAFKVSFKDITILSYDSQNDIAYVSYNVYNDGEFEGSETEYLKKTAGSWGFYGNQHNYDLELQAQSVHTSRYVANVLVTDEEKFSAELRFWSESRFQEVSSISILPVHDDGTEDTAFNALLGGSSSTGLALTFSSSGEIIVASRRYVDYTTNIESATCDQVNDPCGENWRASSIDLTPTILASMKQKQKFALKYTLNNQPITEFFYVNKPLGISAANSAQFMPKIAGSDFCSTPTQDYTFTAAPGTSLDHASASLYFFDQDTMAMAQPQGNASLNGASDTVTLFQSPLPTAPLVLQAAFFYIKSRDQHDRDFVRMIDCQSH